MRAPISETDLQAYVDDVLDPRRRMEVEEYLATRPDEAARLAVYRLQNEELRLLVHRPLRPAPEPLRRLEARLALRLGRRPLLRVVQAAAAVLALAVTGAAGWMLNELGRREPPPLPAPTLASTSPAAPALELTDASPPSETVLGQQTAALGWLSDRLGVAIGAPDLRELGFTLVGGRLLAAGSAPAVKLLYQDEGGRALTLAVALWENRDTSFRFMRDGHLAVLLWQQQPFALALMGEVERGELMRIGRQVQEAFEAAGQAAPPAPLQVPTAPVTPQPASATAPISPEGT
jgi:anti-sigma factor RsiW